MKRLLLLLFVLSGAAVAQLGNTTMLVFPGVPSGACSTLQLGLNMSNGALYSCNNGSWVAGGGSGSGTVSPNNGSVGAIPKYSAAAGSTTVGPDSLLTDSGTELDYTGSGGFVAGANGGSAGVLGLNGSTSGKATCTAPAVAGTSTNPITCTNAFQLPPQLQGYCIGANNNCWSGSTTNSLAAIVGGTSYVLFLNSTSAVTISSIFHAPNNLVRVASNFTTAANTNLQTITGLSWTAIATNAYNYNFHCSLAYSQATANAAVAFGIQAATNAPTNIFATGEQQISTTSPFYAAPGILPTLTTTTATTIVSGTPGATATNYRVTLDGTLELAASANTINFMVSTATSADAVTVLRGSYCMIF